MRSPARDLLEIPPFSLPQREKRAQVGGGAYQASSASAPSYSRMF